MFERLIPNAAACYERNGSLQQNAVATAMGFEPDMKSDIQSTYGHHSVCKLNIMGYIPVVSTFSGAYRTLVGLAYFVKMAVSDILDPTNHTQHLEGLKIAGANIGRGLLEMIPVIGNLFALNIDASRMMHRWSDHGHPYGDSNTIPIFELIDTIGAIPIVGTVINLSRALFFTTNVLVNIPPAMTGNKRYFEAIKFGLCQVGIGILESIPFIGTISAVMRNFQIGTAC